MNFKRTIDVFHEMESNIVRYIHSNNIDMTSSFYWILYYLLEVFNQRIMGGYGDGKTIIIKLSKNGILHPKTQEHRFLASIFNRIREEISFHQPDISDEYEIVKNLLKGVIESSNVSLSEKDVDLNFSVHENKNLITPKIFSDIFEHIFLPEQSKASKTGSYYTPPLLARFLTEKLLSAFRGTHEEDESISEVKIFDPACGSGEFLIQSAEILLKKRREHDIQITVENESKIRKLIVQNQIFGSDKQPIAALISKIRLILWLLVPETKMDSTNFGDSRTDPSSEELSLNIHTEDFFGYLADQSKTKDYSRLNYDIIIGNPPFNARFPEDIKPLLYKKHDGFIKNSAGLFLLEAYNRIKSNSVIGFIVPKSIAYSKRWQSLKNHILKDLTYVRDLSKAFSGVKLEQLIIILNKKINKMNNKNQHKSCYLCDSGDIHTENQFSVEKKHCKEDRALIVGISGAEYALMKKLDNQIANRLGNVIQARRGLNIQKKASEITALKDRDDIIYCIGGARITKYGLKPMKRAIKEPLPLKLVQKIKEIRQSTTIIGQLANAHVKNPIPHYKLAFIHLESNNLERFCTFDTVINISPKEDVNKYYLLCFLNSSLFAWYLYKIVYASAIRSTRLDEIYLKKVPFSTIETFSIAGSVRFIACLFEALCKTLIIIKQEIVYEIGNTQELHKEFELIKNFADNLICFLYLSNDVDQLHQLSSENLLNELEELNEKWSRKTAEFVLGSLPTTTYDDNRGNHPERLNMIRRVKDQYMSRLKHLIKKSIHLFSEISKTQDFHIIQDPFYE